MAKPEMRSYTTWHCDERIPITVYACKSDGHPTIRFGDFGGNIFLDSRKDLERLRDLINEYLTRGPNDLPL